MVKKMKRRARKSKVAKLSLPVKRAIAKAVKAPEEVKFITQWNGQTSGLQAHGALYTAGMGFIGGNPNLPLIPPMAQGNDVGQRIGSKIRPIKLVVDFVVNAANIAYSVDLLARLLILESKNIRDTGSIGSVPMNALLDFGQTQTFFQGRACDIGAPINTDIYKVYMNKVLKINKPAGEGPNLINGYVGNVVSVSPNTVHKFRVVLKCPAVLGYADAGAIFPQGWAPFFNAGYNICPQVNGDAPDTVTTRLQVAFTSTLYYTDA